jgi:hypothetical protein
MLIYFKIPYLLRGNDYLTSLDLGLHREKCTKIKLNKSINVFKEFRTMLAIKIRQHVSEDGILHLDIPVGIVEKDVEVMVIYQPVQEKVVARSLENLYGICLDDPIVIDDLGISDRLDNDLVGAFA